MIARATGSSRLLQNRQDTERIAEYRLAGGYQSLTRPGGELVAEIERAGLRGRGGAGFPTATKWQSVRSADGTPHHIVINAEEGEPASEKDRWLLVHRPHLVLDGALVAAIAIGAEHLWIYVSDDLAAEVIRAALEELARDAPTTVHMRLPSISVVMTNRTYVAGEETAAVRAINGGPALPTAKPPRPYESGVEGQPTLVQNPETLAHVALIARSGAAWFRTVGTASSPGTFLLTLRGDCAATGLHEVEFGMTLRDIIAQGRLGGEGQPDPAGFIIGGYFGGMVGRRAIDFPLEYDALRAEDLMLGCGAITAIGQERCVVGIAVALLEFFAEEGAKQCGVCVRGTEALRDTALRLHRGRADGGETALLARFSKAVRGRGACALPDGAANVATSLCREFPDAISAHEAGSCVACPDDVADLVPRFHLATSLPQGGKHDHES